MLLHTPHNLQAAVAILLAMLAAAAAFCLTEPFSNADIPRALVVTLCAITALLSALGAIGLWRLSYPADGGDWSDGNEDDLVHDFTRVRFAGSARRGGSHDHLRVVERADREDDR